MGGCGSGRMGWRAKAEHALRLDIKTLRKLDCLRPDLSLTLRWTWKSGNSSNITIHTQDNALELIYRFRNSGEEWQDRHQHVMLDHTECNFGGTRPWFICPQCFKRVGVLYFKGLFLCRHCSRVAYSSKSENLPDRMLRKANKIRDRLGADYGLNKPICRPKGMHKNKFWRLKDTVQTLETRALIVRFKMLRRSFGNSYQELLDDWDA